MTTALLKYDFNEIFSTLLLVCRRKGYVVKEIDSEKGIIRAEEKTSFFSWNKIRLELNVNTLDRDVVNVQVNILYKGAPQKELEENFVNSIYRNF